MEGGKGRGVGVRAIIVWLCGVGVDTRWESYCAVTVQSWSKR